jgi:hypothetical protein
MQRELDHHGRLGRHAARIGPSRGAIGPPRGAIGPSRGVNWTVTWGHWAVMRRELGRHVRDWAVMRRELGRHGGDWTVTRRELDRHGERNWTVTWMVGNARSEPLGGLLSCGLSTADHSTSNVATLRRRTATYVVPRSSPASKPRTVASRGTCGQVAPTDLAAALSLDFRTTVSQPRQNGPIGVNQHPLRTLSAACRP